MEEISRHILEKAYRDDLFQPEIFKYYDILSVRVKGREIFFKKKIVAHQKIKYDDTHFIPSKILVSMEVPHSQGYMKKLCEQHKGCRLILEDLQKKGYTVHEDGVP